MKYKYDNFIGIFDSGFGGISVLNYCLSIMPNENYVYFADSSNCPYGKKSKEELIAIGDDILEHFHNAKAKEVIIACNTMSTNVIDHFIAKFNDMYIIGTYPDFTQIFKPGLVLKNESISYDADNNLQIKRDHLKILIIATTTTSKSKYLKDRIKEINGILHIYIEPADFIVQAVENDTIDSFAFRNDLENLFKEYKDIDYLVLGCTHFPFAMDQIKSILNNKIKIVSGCDITSQEAYNYLQNNNELSNIQNPSIRIIDFNINEERKRIYNKLISKGHNIVFQDSF